MKEFVLEPHHLRTLRWIGWQVALGGLLAGLCGLLAFDTHRRFIADIFAWGAWCGFLLLTVEALRRRPALRGGVLFGASVLAQVVFGLAWAPVEFAQRYSFLAMIGYTSQQASAGFPLAEARYWPLHWIVLGVPLAFLADLRTPTPDASRIASRKTARYWVPPMTLLLVAPIHYGMWSGMVNWLFRRPRPGAYYWERFLVGTGPLGLMLVATTGLALLVVLAHLAHRRRPELAPPFVQACWVVVFFEFFGSAADSAPFMPVIPAFAGLPVLAALTGLGLGDRLSAWLDPEPRSEPALELRDPDG